jgi:hypothetical protein
MAALLVALGATALLPGAAHAVVPIEPPDGATTSSTPTFTWRLEPGEDPLAIELTPNPAPGAGGAFTEDAAKRVALLAEGQTAYAVGNRERLEPGQWFWHVGAFGPALTFGWSPTRRFVVPDEPIRLHSLKVEYFKCLRELSVEFEYSDNSAGQPARYRLDFRRRRRGRRVASIGGRAEGGLAFETFRRPRRLPIGRYYVRLELRDGGGHVARSRFRRLRIGRC